MEPGDFFHVPPGHDSWVVGDEPYVSIHIMGSEDYAAWAVPEPLIERYRDELPLEPGDPVVTLNEGSTPLIDAPVISGARRSAGLAEVRGRQPDRLVQGPGDDRGHVARGGRGAEAVICASTGNTAASAAAYAARARMRGAVIVPEGKIAIGKLAQALMHGARVIALRGNFDEALIHRPRAGAEASDRARQLGEPAPDRGPEDRGVRGDRRARRGAGALAIPVGNAGNVTAWNRGFSERDATPVLYGFQAEGAAPLVHGHPVENPETVASAIRIGNPARWEEAMAAITSSRGRIAAVSDEQILDAYRLLASREGVFCEPASAASVAGILAHGLPAIEGDARPSQWSACSPGTA